MFDKGSYNYYFGLNVAHKLKRGLGVKLFIYDSCPDEFHVVFNDRFLEDRYRPSPIKKSRSRLKLLLECLVSVDVTGAEKKPLSHGTNTASMAIGKEYKTFIGGAPSSNILFTASPASSFIPGPVQDYNWISELKIPTVNDRPITLFHEPLQTIVSSLSQGSLCLPPSGTPAIDRLKQQYPPLNCIERGTIENYLTAVVEACKAGVILFIAVGNDGAVLSPVEGPFPAGLEKPPECEYDPLVRVGALSNNDGESSILSKWEYSNYGPLVDIYGPGADVIAAETSLSALVIPNGPLNVGRVTANGNHELFSLVNGTSFTTPFVASIAALIIECRPTISASEMRQILINTSTPLIGSVDINYINAEKAVEYACLDDPL